MQVELKNIKYAEFASEETSCFQAAIYIDGKRAGEVSNSGKGGCNNYHPYQLEKTLNDYAKTLPKIKFQNDEFEQDADTMIGELLTNHLHIKDLKRAMQSRIVFVAADGTLREVVGIKKDNIKTYLSNKALPEKLKAAKVLNLLPFEEAFALYLNHTREQAHATH